MANEDGAGATGNDDKAGAGAGGAGAGGGDGETGDGGGTNLEDVVRDLRGDLQRLTAQNKSLAREVTQLRSSKTGASGDDGDDGDDGEGDGEGDGEAGTGTNRSTGDDVAKQLRKAERARKAAEKDRREKERENQALRSENESLRQSILVGDVASKTRIENRSTVRALMRQAIEDKRVDQGPEDFESEDAREALVVQYVEAIREISPELFGATNTAGGRRGSAGVSSSTKSTTERPKANAGDFNQAAATDSMYERLYSKKRA